MNYITILFFFLSLEYSSQNQIKLYFRVKPSLTIQVEVVILSSHVLSLLIILS